jgi:hypothetical protein
MNRDARVTERTIRDQVLAGKLVLPPVKFSLIGTNRRLPAGTADFCIEGRWPDGKARFVVEAKSQSTPKEFETAVGQAEAYSQATGDYPMVVLPYLRESQLRELEGRGVSGVDLCGNGVVVVPGRLTVFRTGSPNQFRSSAPIKNVYRRNTAMVGRLFFTTPAYPDLRAVGDAVNARNLLVQGGERTPMRVATVWKALKGLQDDLIVAKEDGFRLLQADTLLDKLVENYQPPEPARRVMLKIDSASGNLKQWFAQRAGTSASAWMLTGLSSVERYAVMAREEVIAVYCTKLDDLRAAVGGKENVRFPNVELIEVEDEPVYFDPQEDKNLRWASPVQCYLELMAGDKRDQETADQVRAYLLNHVGGARP